MPLAVREGGHGPGGVVADSGQGEQVIHRGGYDPTVPIRDRHGCGMQVQRPTRIPKAIPRAHRLGWGSDR